MKLLSAIAALSYAQDASDYASDYAQDASVKFGCQDREADWFVY